MESNSVRNKITLSPAAAIALGAQAPEVSLVSRGEHDIKGKGQMEIFFLDDAPEAAASTLAAPLLLDEYSSEDEDALLPGESSGATRL